MNFNISGNGTLSFEEELKRVVSRNGWDLRSLSNGTPVLVVFLRHLGCVFCRESLSELRRLRSDIEKNVRIAVVHMGTDEQASELLAVYDLGDVERFSDPERKLYNAFGLQRTTIGKMLGPRNWLDMIRVGTSPGSSLGRIVGDVLQMPGVFLISEGMIIGDFRPERIGEKPEYLEIAALEC